MADEKKSPTRTERDAGLQRGYMSQVKSGKIRSPGPDVIRALADYLHVQFEWLAIGRGPMREEAWASSPLESAMRFALLHGARQDAIDAAVDRYRDAPDMTGNDWILAFNSEAIRLERAGVPRPEKVAAAQRKTRRLAKKLMQQKAAAAAADSARTARPSTQPPTSNSQRKKALG